jgi:hypothetical protein
MRSKVLLAQEIRQRDQAADPAGEWGASASSIRRISSPPGVSKRSAGPGPADGWTPEHTNGAVFTCTGAGCPLR